MQSIPSRALSADVDIDALRAEVGLEFPNLTQLVTAKHSIELTPQSILAHTGCCSHLRDNSLASYLLD